MRERFGAFTFDTETHRLERDGAEVHLTPKAFDLLALLIQAAPRVLPKAELHERLWPGSFVSDATLVGLVKEIRRALADQSGAPLIRTVHRVGYAFSGSIEASRAAPILDAPHWIVRGQQRIALTEGANVIGRDPEATIWIDATGVSRRHARIVVNGTSATLEDLGSKNGTMRGGERVREAVALRDADRIQIAGAVLVFRASVSGISTQTEPKRARQKKR